MIVSEMIKHANKRRFFMSQNFLNAAGVIPIFLSKEGIRGKETENSESKGSEYPEAY